MMFTPDFTPPPRAKLAASELFPELMSSSPHMLEPGDAIEAYRAFADGALATVPLALEAYMSHQQSDCL